MQQVANPSLCVLEKTHVLNEQIASAVKVELAGIVTNEKVQRRLGSLRGERAVQPGVRVWNKWGLTARFGRVYPPQASVQ